MNNMEQTPWIAGLIKRLRPDISQQLSTEPSIASEQFLRWLVTSGIQEYAILQQDEELQNYLSEPVTKYNLTRLQYLIYGAHRDVQQAFPLPSRYNEFLHWFYTHGVKNHHLGSFLSSNEKKWLTDRGYNSPHFRRIQAEIKNNLSDYPFGVNLIGHVYGQLGIGEDVRMAAITMREMGIPFTIINFPPGDDVPQNDLSMAEHVDNRAPYAFNIFCMTAIEQARFYVVNGKRFMRGKYTIGYWPWELSQWPDDWLDLTHLVDEVWVSTRHIYDSLSPVSPVPVLVMPTAVELGELSSKSRKDFSLPEGVKLFCFSFDLKSSIHRKNPHACVEAFLDAFPLPENQHNVGLVIKVHPPKTKHQEWENLKTLASRDERVHIIEETLSRPDLLALYQCCDCFLSLHRAEGFGRGIAEAIQLGLHVITTGYSGNLDFCRPPQTDLVNYKLVKVKQGEYPHGDNQVWADVDVKHASQLMRAFIDQAIRVDAGKSQADNAFAAQTVGRRYEQRLNYLHEKTKVQRTK